MDGKEPVLLKPRLISMSRNGRFVAIRQPSGVDLVDAMGTNPRLHLDVADVEDFCFVGRSLWLVTATELRILSGDGSEERARSTAVSGPGRLFPVPGDASTSALWRGPRDLLVAGRAEVATDDLSELIGGAHFAAPLSGERLLVEDGGRASLVNRDGKVSRAFPSSFTVSEACELFGGRALAVAAVADGQASVLVLQPSGARIHQIPIPRGASVAIAETRGLAIAYDRQLLTALDLRYGRELGRGEVPLELAAVVIDTSGKFIAAAGFHADSDQLSVLHLPYTSVFQSKRKDKTPTGGPESSDDESERKSGTHELREPPAPSVDAAEVSAGEGEHDEASEEVAEPAIEIPDLRPLALAPLPQSPRPPVPDGVAPYEHVDQHLEDLVELIAAKTAHAIAESWDSGRLSLPNLDSLPFEHEVGALVGERANGARLALDRARQRVDTLAAELAQRAQATLAQGLSLPFFEVVAEFGLSKTAAQALVVAAAPQVRGEVARLYGVLANDEGRPICDRYLVELILGGEDRRARQEVARELEQDAPLLHFGLVRVLPAAPDMYLFAPLTVDPALIARLKGHPFAGYEAGTVTEIHRAEKALHELAIADAVKRDIVVDLSEPPLDGRPVRVVLRGRPGSGRTSLLATLAGQVGRAIAMIDCERLPRDGRALAQRLRIELRRAALRGALPCVSGIEVADSADAEGVEHIREVFRSHPGPVLFRTTPEYRPPLEPGYLDYTLPPLSEGKRHEFWDRAVASAGLHADGAALAARFRIGPGTIERVVANVRLRLEAGALEEADDYTFVIDEAARQHIDTRLSSVASRVTRLAHWEQVALPDDVLDSIREFIGRVRHRRTVYESWGFDRKMSTSRGLTALFYGAPGTGKTMVAGLIARELKLDLYRVDLAKITSKWVGETEKNLANVFDAAEDGQAVIVFDEADSLFAKRTEVKSSVDRYANLEVNYLLQRLDSFEGIAILTTNLEGSIDSAFKRRLSLRLAFPFPDEDMRVRLWSAHLPPELPTAGDFDFEDIAKRFPMSGGYIRNCTIRAAFLAAQEKQPLSQEHLLRAIHLEYREMGKLSAGGRIE